MKWFFIILTVLLAFLLIDRYCGRIDKRQGIVVDKVFQPTIDETKPIWVPSEKQGESGHMSIESKHEDAKWIVVVKYLENLKYPEVNCPDSLYYNIEPKDTITFEERKGLITKKVYERNGLKKGYK